MDLYDKTPSRAQSTVADVVLAVCVAFCAALIYLTLGCSGPSAEEVTAEAERAAFEKKITFTMPLEYTATVSQCTVKDGCRTRHYFPSSKKAEVK